MTNKKEPNIFFRNFDLSNADFIKKIKKIKERKKKMRAAILESSNKDKNELNDTLENQVTEMPWNPAEVCGPLGILDGIYPQEDLEGKPSTNLYYGRLDNHYVKD